MVEPGCLDYLAELTAGVRGVAGVITDDHGRALLIQRRDNGRWEPSGGVLELAESIHDGLCREVREETGLDVEPIILTGVYKNITRGIIALVSGARSQAGSWPPTKKQPPSSGPATQMSATS